MGSEVADPSDPAEEQQPPQVNMRRSASLIMIGTLGGNGIAWLLNFALARIFTNADFGAASVVIAVASVFIGVSTLRLEVLSQRVQGEDEARLLLSAGLSLSIWWGVGLTLAAGVAVAFGAAAYWWALGLMVTMGSLALIGAATLTRRRAYGRLTFANLQQAAGMSVLQVGFGLLHSGVLSLLAGFVAARLVWLPMLKGVRPVARPWRALTAAHRRFGLVAGSSALVNALAGQVSILLVGVFYTSADTGNYSMAVRVLGVPLAVLSQAVAAAAIGEIGALIRSGSPWYATVRRTVLELAGIGAVICGAAYFLAEPLAPFLLGENFEGAGQAIGILAIGSWLQFAVSPFSQLLNLTSAHRALLGWDVARLLLLTLSWVIPGALGAPLTVSLISYSAAMSLVYLLLFWLIRGAARRARAHG